MMASCSMQAWPMGSTKTCIRGSEDGKAVFAQGVSAFLVMHALPSHDSRCALNAGFVSKGCPDAQECAPVASRLDRERAAEQRASGTASLHCMLLR